MYNIKRLIKLLPLAVIINQICDTAVALPRVSNPFDPYNPLPDLIVKGADHVNLQVVANGLTAPNSLTHAGDGTDRQFLTDQTGYVRLIKNDVLQNTPFLDLSAQIVVLKKSYDERGLLGLAFSPQFAKPGTPGFGKFYTYTSEPVNGIADYTTLPAGTPADHQNVLNEWQVDASNPDIANPASRREILRVDWPQFNHNSGNLAFGPDGYLYVGMGDGGGGNDMGVGHGTTGNSRNLGVALGKIHRIDPNGTNSPNGKYGIPADNPFVHTPGALPEIYAYGLRHPWRFSFDTLTGQLVEGETGQATIEEVNIITPGGNFGWNYKEGQFAFNPATTLVSDDLSALPSGLIDPVLEYDHINGTAMIGGFVYRGSAIPSLYGKYIFADWGAYAGPTARLFEGDFSTGIINELNIDNMNLAVWIEGFGQDANGELYVLTSNSLGPKNSVGTKGQITYTGQVLKITGPLLGDLNADGDVDTDDINLLKARYGQTVTAHDPADLNNDGKINVLDYRKEVSLCTRPHCATQ